MAQYANRAMVDWLVNEVESLKVRVAKLEVGESKEGTIKPETKLGRKNKE